MSVLQSTYYKELPNLDRYGDLEESATTVEVHVAATFWEHVHISIGDAEVNLTIENAEAILAGLEAAMRSAIKGRNLNK